MCRRGLTGVFLGGSIALAPPTWRRGDLQTLLSWAEGAEAPFLYALQKASLPCERLACLTEGQGAVGHTRLQWWQPWPVPAAHSEHAVYQMESATLRAN